MAFTVSVDAKTKKTTRKTVKKTERAMTAFEKRQKEEYLLCLLIRCEYYYYKGDYESAEINKRTYERVKKENYYVEFKNIEYSEKEKKELERLGVDTSPHTYFYKDGFAVKVYFNCNGKAVLDYNSYSRIEREAVTYYYSKRVREKWEKEGKSSTFSTSPNTKELIDEINEASGYNVRHESKKDEIAEFLNSNV